VGIARGSFVRRGATVDFSPAFQGRDHAQVNLLRRSRDDGHHCEPFLALKVQAKVNRRSATKKERYTMAPIPPESA